MRVIESRPDLTVVHWTGSRGCWATRGRQIFRSDHPAGPWRRWGCFPSSGPQDWLGLGRLARRLLRADKCNVWPTRTGRMLGIRGSRVLRYFEEANSTPTVLFEIDGDCVMNRALAEDSDGNIYFGEYFMNPHRVPVRIWQVDASLEVWRVAFRFEEPRIRHVHAIHADPFVSDRLWITMGDFAGECFLGYTDDRFESVQFVGDGSQLWRSVGLLFTQNEIVWLTDSHIAQNHVVSLARNRDEPVIHGDRDASSWYMARTDDGLSLATTTVEPGPSIHTNQVRLLASYDNVEWRPVATFQKDWYPMRGFGFGSLSLPAGALDSSGFWLSGEGIVGLDGRSIFCTIESDE